MRHFLVEAAATFVVGVILTALSVPVQLVFVVAAVFLTFEGGRALYKRTWAKRIVVAYRTLFGLPVSWVGIVTLGALIVVGYWWIAQKMFAEPTAEQALKERVLVEIGLACHRWKNAYIDLYPDGHFLDATQPGEYADIWDMMLQKPFPTYSESEWNKYLPLFAIHTNSVLNRLNQIQATNSDVIPPDIRLLIEEIKGQMLLEQSAYLSIPSDDWPDPNLSFHGRFKEMLLMLSQLDRNARRLSEE